MKRIGITQRVDVIAGRRERRDALDQRWTTLLQKMGAAVFPLSNQEMLANSYLDGLNLDGVIFSGGNDPAGAPGASDVAPERDAMERTLLRLCLERGTPVLGVCRGAQVLNLFLGGRLSRIEGHIAVRHTVELKRAGAFGWPGHFEVNSFHGYGISEADLAPGLEVIARSKSDQTVEAFRMPEKPVAGILWHPEREPELSAEDHRLFRQLFGLA